MNKHSRFDLMGKFTDAKDNIVLRSRDGPKIHKQDHLINSNSPKLSWNRESLLSKFRRGGFKAAFQLEREKSKRSEMSAFERYNHLLKETWDEVEVISVLIVTCNVFVTFV